MIPTQSHLVDYARARVEELEAANRDTIFEPNS